MGAESVEIIKGYYDLPNELLITKTTKFGVASFGKIFVAVAILQLIEAEKLSFKTTLQDVFQKPLGQLGMQTTIKELLTHQSTIPDYFDEAEFDDYSLLWQTLPNYQIRKNKDILPLFINKPPVENSEFCYNNSGYILLAEIIEQVTVMPFDAYLQENIFDVVGMINTGYYALDKLPANTATAYIFDDEKNYHSNIYSIDVKGTGAGGCFTNYIDLQKFWYALYNFNLLNAKLVSLMTDINFSNNENYGLGVWLLPNGFSCIQGQDPGINAISIFHPQTDFTLTIISNTESNVWQLRRDIFTLLF